MTTEPGRWRFVGPVSAKPQGTVWAVRRIDGLRGFFKFAAPSQWSASGPMIANEWITATLARALGFPAAALEIATVIGPAGQAVTGLISQVPDGVRVTTWREASADVRSQPDRRLRHFTRLRQLVVFDAWTVNVDRASGRNLVLYRAPSDAVWSWYLIDHGLSLYGAPYKWNPGPPDAPFWQDLWRYYHVPRGLLMWQSDWGLLEPMVARIEGLPTRVLASVVADAPVDTVSPDLADFTLALLERRRSALRHLIRRWLDYNGVKEYGAEA